MIDYGMLFFLLSFLSGILTKGSLKRGYIIAIIFGNVMILKLVVYILFVKLIQIYLVPFHGFVDFAMVETLKYILLGFAVGGFGYIHIVRKKALKKLQAGNLEKKEIVRRLLNLSVAIYALCESIAVFGLVLFLLSGSTLDFYVFLVLCLVCLGIYFPRYGQWEQWANFQEPKKLRPIWGSTAFVVFFTLWIIVELSLSGGKVLYYQGIVLLENDQYNEAIAAFNEFIEKNPENATAYFYRGRAYQEGNLYTTAITDYSKALEIDSRMAEAYINRGNAYLYKRHIDKSIADFNNAIEIIPDLALAYNNRGFAYYCANQYEKAWDDVNKAQNLGYQVSPTFLKALREASGRQK